MKLPVRKKTIAFAVGLVGFLASLVGLYQFFWPLSSPPLKIPSRPLIADIQAADSASFFVPHLPNANLQGLDYTGRLFKEIDDKLTRHGQVVLSGIEGMGGREYVVLYTFNRQERYPGGVYWLRADNGLAQGYRELARLMAGLGHLSSAVADLPDTDLVRLMRSRLNDRPGRKLVIVAGLADWSARVHQALPNKDLDLMATSHSAALPLPIIGLESLNHADALALACHAAGRSPADLTDREKEVIETICTRMGCTALALEVAGGRLKFQSADTLLREIKDSRLADIEGQSHGRGRTNILAVLGLTGLPPREQQLLTLCGYLDPEGIEAGLAAEILTWKKPKANKALAGLARRNLLALRRDGAYAVNPLIQRAVREGDGDNEQGKRAAAWLDARVREAGSKGDYRSAARLTDHLVHLAGLARPGDPLDRFPAVEMLNRWGLYLDNSGRFQPAERLLRASLDRRRLHLSPDDPDLATSLNNLAGVLGDQGDYAQAEKLYRQALEIDRKSLGPDHPGYAIDLNNLALVLSSQGDYAQAEKLYRKALEIDRKSLGPDHPNYAASLNNLAGVLGDQGDYAEAERLYRQAMEIMERRLGPDHPHTRIVRANLAVLEQRRKKLP